MSQEDTDRLERIESKVDRLTIAVMGDEEAGHRGLVFRTNNHASRIHTLERVVYWWGAAIAGGAFVVGLLHKLVTDWMRR